MSDPFIPVRYLIGAPDSIDDPDIFPLLPGQMFVSEKAPEWATTVKRTKSGREVRSGEWTSPRWTFQVSYEVLREKPTMLELSRLIAFFNKRRGRLGEFFYYDPTDHTVTDQALGFGNGVQASFQLVRSILGEIEPVYVVWGSPTVMIDGVPLTSGWSIVGKGVLVFDVPPAAGKQVSWTGTFLYWCRFDQDKLSAKQMTTRLWSQDGLSFVSLKP